MGHLLARVLSLPSHFYPEAGGRNLQRNVAASSQITVRDLLFYSDDGKSRFFVNVHPR
jgi:hypothetical protein